MRDLAISFCFAVAITMVLAYLPFALNPFNQTALEQYQREYGVETRDELRRNLDNLITTGSADSIINTQNLFIIVVLLLVSIGSWVFFVQILIYRLARRRFNGNKEYLVALRRASWVSIVIGAFIYYRFNTFPLYMYIITPLLFVIVEYLVSTVRFNFRSEVDKS